VPGGRSGNVRWGQNFLVDRNVANAIVDWAGIEGRAVLEVGPGRGILTELLALRAASLCAVEIDNALAESLALRFAERPDVRIVAGDALTVDLRSLIAASPGEKGYGLLAVHTQLAADVSMGRVVAPGCFRPQPKVESQIIRITPLAGLRYEVGQREVFDILTSVAFQGRRKMVRNTLGAWVQARCGDGAAERAFAAAQIRPDQRPETVSIDSFAALSNWVTREKRD